MSKSRKPKQSLFAQYDVLIYSFVLAGVLSYVWRTFISDWASQYVRFNQIVVAILAIDAVVLMQTKRLNNKNSLRLLQLMVHTSALFLAFLLFWGWFNWEHWNNEWVHENTFFTGKMGISFLFLSLLCTPLVTLFGWKQPNALRKPTGNYGFMFVCLHLLLFSADYGLDVQSGSWQIIPVIQEAILKRYALIGLIAFILLVPLAVTSNKYSQKRLGRNWKKLHKLTYAISVLAVMHYFWVWLSKRALAEPIIFAIMLAFLLLLRVKPIKDRIRTFKQQRRKAKRERLAT